MKNVDLTMKMTKICIKMSFLAENPSKLPIFIQIDGILAVESTQNTKHHDTPSAIYRKSASFF